MPTDKKTPSDRTKRQPRDPSPDRKRRGWNPADDIYGSDKRPTDADMDLDKGKYSTPPPRR